MNQRIPALPDDRVPEAARPVLAKIGAALGKVPNLHRTLAHSPAALRAYAATAEALAGGVLPPALREHIAVASAGLNGCDYCASAHTAIGQRLGIDRDELARNLDAESASEATAAVLAFVRALRDRRGDVTDAELDAVRRAGFDDAAIVEIVAHVGMNAFTNTFNILAATEVDFPPVDVAAARSGRRS